MRGPTERMRHVLGMAAAAVAIFHLVGAAARAQDTAPKGDPARGARDFRVCAPCHALEPDRNVTGPSLAGVWGRKAGGLTSFERYSPALKASGVVWDAETLDEWLKNPERLIPHNRMTFAGIPDARDRADLVAYLRAASAGNAPKAAQDGAMGGMGGMMGGGEVPDLKKIEPSERVKSVAWCRDTYKVTTVDGETHDFWERNLRFKTDGSDKGPAEGAPALVGAGMMGDRGDVIFAKPDEIGRFVKQDCSMAPMAK
jgi:cytochrome c